MRKNASILVLALLVLGTVSCGGVYVGTCYDWWCWGTWPIYPLAAPCDTCRTPVSVEIADVDGDGVLDIVAGGEQAGNVSILLGKGDGTFESALREDLDLGHGADHAFVGPVNDDARFDLILFDGIDGRVLVLLSQEGGGFVRGPDDVLDLGLAARVEAVDKGDLDGDGDTDFVVVGENGEALVLLAQDDGSLDEPAGGRTQLGVGFAGLAIVDLDADGVPEVLVLDDVARTVEIVSGDGAGALLRTGTTRDVGTLPRAVAFGDFDGEDGVDVAVLDASGGQVHILLGDGLGGLQDAHHVITLPTSEGRDVIALPRENGNPSDLAIAYVDDDGRHAVQGWWNLGDGTFGEPGRPFHPPSFEGRLATADLNGDGRPDLVWAAPDAVEVGVALGGRRRR